MAENDVSRICTFCGLLYDVSTTYFCPKCGHLDDSLRPSCSDSMTAEPPWELGNQALLSFQRFAVHPDAELFHTGESTISLPLSDMPNNENPMNFCYDDKGIATFEVSQRSRPREGSTDCLLGTGLHLRKEEVPSPQGRKQNKRPRAGNLPRQKPAMPESNTVNPPEPFEAYFTGPADQRLSLGVGASITTQQPFYNFEIHSTPDTRNKSSPDSFHTRQSAISSFASHPRSDFAYRPAPPANYSGWEADSLSRRRINDFVADEDSPFQPSKITGKFDKISSVLETSIVTPRYHPIHPLNWAPKNFTPSSEHREGWELVEPFNHARLDVQRFYSEATFLDTKSDDTKSLGRVLEPLDSRYTAISKPHRFFKIGRVFMTLWSEPASSTARDSPHVSSSSIGGRIYSETRRFVVVRGGSGYCLCCPIHTYRKQGTKKSRITLEDHAIVYADGSEPKLLPQERVPGMGSFPIVVLDKFVTIDPASRLNFGKVYTVEHNIKVRNIGKIEKASLPRLRAALIKAMGIDESDPDVETETEEY